MMTTFELLVDISVVLEVPIVIDKLSVSADIDPVLVSYLHNKGLTIENLNASFITAVYALAFERKASKTLELLSSFTNGKVVYTTETLTLYHHNDTFFSVKVDGIRTFHITKKEATQAFLEYLKP